MSLCINGLCGYKNRSRVQFPCITVSSLLNKRVIIYIFKYAICRPERVSCPFYSFWSLQNPCQPERFSRRWYSVQGCLILITARGLIIYQGRMSSRCLEAVENIRTKIRTFSVSGCQLIQLRRLTLFIINSYSIHILWKYVINLSRIWY